ncbi:hypothetical protein M433DRAFT_134618 [Acidomyces richmondensis BFW]|nr:MAG: hypothetical protein FE78DRAFT_70899 [Acidomyces sp. 'richmondensis']KYG45565.1 hypothetical protein M433DRAFT_134618 [Acidomyces richmondensis BFW]
MCIDDGQDAANAQHLVVMIHGLWGNPVHLKHIRDALASEYEGRGLYIFTPKSNSDQHTYDGIEVGAERITHEIETKLRSIEKAGGHIEKMSIVGYSLGGLVSRYIVGLLYSNGVFQRIQPVNFTTFATPHLGVRTPKLGYRAQTWNFLGSKTLSTSGQQMFLADDFRGTGRPLLAIMADPTSIFVKGLCLFNMKSIYANIINDRSVPYYTAAISRIDPFVNLGAVDVHPLQDQEYPVILDPACPVSPRKHETAASQLTWQETIQKTRENLPFYAFIFGMIPLAIPLFLVNAGYQTFKSMQRVRMHEKGSLIDLQRYRIPLLEESQATQDRLVTHLASTSSGDNYLPTPPPEPFSQAPSLRKLSEDQSVEDQSAWPILALTNEQFEMIDHLDQHVNFTKYAVHIQKVRHTHAAIIVRMPKESFVEGKEVSRHWVRNFQL